MTIARRSDVIRMHDPEDHVADHASAALRELRADLNAFEQEMTSAGIPASLRTRLRNWWEERIGGRILDHGERTIRGIRREN